MSTEPDATDEEHVHRWAVSHGASATMGDGRRFEWPDAIIGADDLIRVDASTGELVITHPDGSEHSYVPVPDIT